NLCIIFNGQSTTRLGRDTSTGGSLRRSSGQPATNLSRSVAMRNECAPSRITTVGHKCSVDLEPKDRRDHEERFVLPRSRVVAQNRRGIFRLDKEPVRDQRNKTVDQQIPVGNLYRCTKRKARLVQVFHLRVDPV